MRGVRIRNVTGIRGVAGVCGVGSDGCAGGDDDGEGAAEVVHDDVDGS